MRLAASRLVGVTFKEDQIWCSHKGILNSSRHSKSYVGFDIYLRMTPYLWPSRTDLCYSTHKVLSYHCRDNTTNYAQNTLRGTLRKPSQPRYLSILEVLLGLISVILWIDSHSHPRTLLLKIYIAPLMAYNRGKIAKDINCRTTNSQLAQVVIRELIASKWPLCHSRVFYWRLHCLRSQTPIPPLR